MNEITINPNDIFLLLKAASMFVGWLSLIALCLTGLGLIEKENRESIRRRAIFGIIFGCVMWGSFSFTGFYAENRRIHEENFAALSTQWQNFYTTLNEMDMNATIQLAAIRDFIRNTSPSLTLEEYDVLGGKGLCGPQRTLTQNVIRTSPSLQGIIEFNFARKKE